MGSANLAVWHAAEGCNWTSRHAISAHIIAAMWPWQVFDWGVFWAIIAAGVIYLILANIINLLIARLQEWGDKAP